MDEVPEFDLYRELEVRDDASPETIDAAYRSLAKRFHPDSAIAAQEATRRMARINIAHDWLSSVDRRAHYDQARGDHHGHSQERPE